MIVSDDMFRNREVPHALRETLDEIFILLLHLRNCYVAFGTWECRMGMELLIPIIKNPLFRRF